LRNWPAALVLEDPYQLWAAGMFDDYPRLNWAFCESLPTNGNNDAGSFDKLAALAAVLKEFNSPETLVRHGRPPLGCLAGFRKYVKTRVASCRRIIPLAAAHLFDSAESCVGKDYGQGLARTLLEYPVPEEQGAPAFLVGSNGIRTGGHPFDLPDVFHALPYYGQSRPEYRTLILEEEEQRDQWVHRVHPFLTRQEEHEIDGYGWSVRWSIIQDYHLHQTACDRLREIVNRGSAVFQIKRSWGSLGDGIHWYATLAAMERGEDAVYIKKKLHTRKFGRLDEDTPVVFLLASDQEIDASTTSCIHDSNVTLRKLELLNQMSRSPGDPPPDMVYSIFLTTTGTEYLWDAHVQRESLTSLVLLHTRDLMGVARHEAINKLPKTRQCRLDPMCDPALNGLRLSERGLAWAIKYARDVVIVTAPAGWAPSPRVANFAKERRVEMVGLPLSVLSEAMVRRLAQFHFTSGALKQHPRYVQIVDRFVA